MSSPITTHVLDTASGRPAAGVPLALLAREGDGWRELAAGVTNDDGRVADLLESGRLEPGDYRMRFDTASYFAAQKVTGFYPQVEIEFTIRDAGQHYHVPLLLSPYGYSTYRGS